MKLRRLLPPALLVGILGFFAYRAMERPRREVMQRHIQVRWEDRASWGKLQEEIGRYEEQYRTPEDRAFAAHAYLRVRRPGEALRARWPDLERPLVPAEVKAFAEQALLLLGWDDEQRLRRSPVYVQAVLALLEGGNALAREDLLQTVRREPLHEVQDLMRRIMGMPGATGRGLVTTGLRERGADEQAAGRAQGNWEVAAALMAPKSPPYPEQEQDIQVLLGVVMGSWRTEFQGRWGMACRALGETQDPRGIQALRDVVATLEGTPTTRDGAASTREEKDLAVLRLGLLSAGDWTVEPELRRRWEGPSAEMSSPGAYYQDVLLFRWRANDPRARAALDALWEGPGTDDPTVRERLARGQLLGHALPGPDVPAERMLADLEAPEAVPGLVVLAKAFRLRRGEPGAREALLKWMTGEQGENLTPAGGEVEQSLSAPISALRALYLYD